MADQNFKLNFIASIQDVTRNTKLAKNSVDGLGKSATKLKGGFAGFYSEMRKNNMMFTNFTKDANRANDGVIKLNKSLGGFSQVIGMAKSSLLAFSFANAINSATEMVETTNLFNVAMGDNVRQSAKFVDAMSEAYGFDKTNIMSAVGTYSLLARSMGMTSDQAQVLSENTYKLAVDLSSLTNVPINQVLGDLRSGLVGQSETVYKYGLDITEATLKTEALAQGIEKSVRNMSQGEKMALRYSAMIRQSSLAHGDFARTIETPANQMKIMSELTVTLTRTIGTVFLPMLAKILPYLNAFLMVLIRIVKAIASFFGYVDPGFVDGLGSQMGGYGEDFADSMGDALDKAKKMKSVMMGFDELNVIPEETDSGGGAGAGATVGGIDFDLPSFSNLMETIQNRTKDIADKLQGPLENVLKLVGLIGAGFLAWKVGNILYTLYLITSALVAQVTQWVLVNVQKGISLARDIALFTGGLIRYTTIATIELGKQFALWLKVNIQKGISFIRDTALAGAGLIRYMALATIELGKQVGAWILLNAQKLVATIQNGLLTASIVAYNIATGIATTVTGAFATVMAVLTSPIGLVVLAITALIAIVVLLVQNWDTVKAVASDVWEGIKRTWEKASDWFSKTVAEPLKEVMKGAGNFIIGVWNGVVGAFEQALNFIISGINKFISWIDQLVESINNISEKIGLSISFNMSPISPVSFGRVPALARGGSLERGQLFEAGEFGKAEAIGSYQGKTTVMPLENTDFVGAIYNAVRDAMSDVEGGGQVIENVLLLDGEQIYRNQKKVESKRGYDFGLGVFAR